MNLTININVFDAQRRQVLGMQHDQHRTDSYEDMLTVVRTLNRAKHEDLSVEFTMHTCDPEENTQKNMRLLEFDDDPDARSLKYGLKAEPTRLLWIKVLELLFYFAHRQNSHYSKEKQPPDFIVDINDYNGLFDKYATAARTKRLEPIQVADAPTPREKPQATFREAPDSLRGDRVVEDHTATPD